MHKYKYNRLTPFPGYNGDFFDDVIGLDPNGGGLYDVPIIGDVANAVINSPVGNVIAFAFPPSAPFIYAAKAAQSLASGNELGALLNAAGGYMAYASPAATATATIGDVTVEGVNANLVTATQQAMAGTDLITVAKTLAGVGADKAMQVLVDAGATEAAAVEALNTASTELAKMTVSSADAPALMEGMRFAGLDSTMMTEQLANLGVTGTTASDLIQGAKAGFSVGQLESINQGVSFSDMMVNPSNLDGGLPGITPDPTPTMGGGGLKQQLMPTDGGLPGGRVSDMMPNPVNPTPTMGGGQQLAVMPRGWEEGMPLDWEPPEIRPNIPTPRTGAEWEQLMQTNGELPGITTSAPTPEDWQEGKLWDHEADFADSELRAWGGSSIPGLEGTGTVFGSGTQGMTWDDTLKKWVGRAESLGKLGSKLTGGGSRGPGGSGGDGASNLQDIFNQADPYRDYRKSVEVPMMAAAAGNATGLSNLYRESYTNPMGAYNTPEMQAVRGGFMGDLERRDAAAGRNTQYGSRDVEAQNNYLSKTLPTYRAGITQGLGTLYNAAKPQPLDPSIASKIASNTAQGQGMAGGSGGQLGSLQRSYNQMTNPGGGFLNQFQGAVNTAKDAKNVWDTGKDIYNWFN